MVHSKQWMRVGWMVVMVSACVMTGCDPLGTQFESVEPARTYRASDAGSSAEAVEAPKVMTYNIKFGGGRVRFFFDCPGDRVLLERREVIGHLEGIAEKIREVDPDILLLQEIDINSKRSAYVDQVAWLMAHTALDHAAYASQWRALYVPKNGLGRVNSGNAILSKWPIRQAKRHALPLIGTQGWLTQYFYLKRNVLTGRIEVPGWGPLWVANTHLTAFAKDDTSARQVEDVGALLGDLGRREAPFVFGGDLNLLPPGTEKTSGFTDDAKCNDPAYETPSYAERLHLLEPLYEAYHPAVDLGAYQESPQSFYTYTGDPEVGWTRKLDYLFTNAQFDGSTVVTHQGTESGSVQTLRLSDHAPLSGRLAH
jgi:endonuclease/exonuclease/phosphatase family metal-dependent hydrolase